MKIAGRRLLNLLAVTFMAAALAPATQAGVELTVSLEGQTASTNRAKFGHPKNGWFEYASDCIPDCETIVPKYYKSLTINYYEDITVPGLHRGTDHTFTLTYTNESQAIYTSAYGSAELSTAAESCMNTCNATLQCDPFVPFWTQVSYDCVNNTYTTNTGQQQVCAYVDWPGEYTYECLSDTSVKWSSEIEDFGENWYTVALSDEYGTGELLDLGGFDYQGNEWNDTSGGFASIAGDESGATIQKGKYRFKVLAEKGRRYRIHYVEHYSGGGLYTNRVVTLPGIGTGRVQYFDGPEYFPESTEIVVNGCTNIVGVAKWVTLSCSSYDNPDGTSGCGGSGDTGSCVSCTGGPGSVTSCPYPMRLSVGLGSGAFGEGHGQLILAEPSPSTNLISPSGLEYFGSYEGVEIKRQGGVLRQVLSPQMLADIKTNNATSYSIRLYTSYGSESSGLYDVTGHTPFSTTTIAQGTSTNQLLVTVDNGTTTEYIYDWSEANQGWTLTSGEGARKQSVTWNSTALSLTNLVRDAADQAVSKTIDYFAEFGSLGQQAIKGVVDPDGAALTSQWFYYDNPTTDGTNYGEIKLMIEPAGFWKRYEYDTNNRVTKEISQFLNAATNAAENLCRVVEYDYNSPSNTFSWERRVEKLLGQEIGRQYTLYYGWKTVSIQCQTPGAAWDAADNLVTTTEVYPSGEFVGDTRRVLHPDGTMQLYEYAANSVAKTTTIYSGQPNGGGTAIVDGTETITVTDITGAETYRMVYDIASDILIANDYHTYDDLGRLISTSYLDGTTTSATYACCGMDTSTDRDGTVTSYAYDALKRQAAVTRNGITTINVLDAAGRLLATVRIGTDSSRITNSMTAYDLAGRITRATNALGGVTIYTNRFDGSGQLMKTNTAPDGGTRVEIYYQDGSMQKVLGSAAFPVRYDYGVESDGGVSRAYTKEIKLDASGTDTSEWTKTFSDMLGRGYKTVSAAASGSPASLSFYNTAGQLWKQVDPDGVTTLYQYNGAGELEYTAVDLNTNGVIDFSGTDRITRTVTLVTNNNGYNLRRTLAYAWTTDSQTNALLASTRDVAVNGLRTWNTIWNHGLPVTSEGQTDYPGGGTRTVKTIAADGSYAVNTYSYGRLQSVVRKDAAHNLLMETTYAYDAHGRAHEITDARNGTTTNWFNAADQISGTRTPIPAPGQSSQTTTNYFDTLGRTWKTTLPDSTSVTNEFFTTGLLKKTYGSRTYPVEYTYDAQGRMKTMKTWQNFAAGSGTATTTWNYDKYRGWLTNKVYADGKGTIYTNTAAGRLKSRTWARGVNTIYSYNNAGDLSGVDYSDTTPDVTYSYDRRGRQTTMAAGGVTTTKAYNDAGLLTTESYGGGPLNGLSVTNGYDQYLRRTNLATLNGSTLLTRSKYSYDSAARLDTVTDLTPGTPHSAQYTYLANSPLVEQITFATNGTPVMTTTKGYDALNRLTNIASSSSSFSSSFAYQYNSANQRTAVTNADNARWVYTYDSLGQVTGGKKYWSDGTPVAGQHFEYAFDTIGNRQSTKAGGDNSGAGLRPAAYSVNTLNQYTSREVPGYVNSLGSANSNATVTLWSDTGLFAPTLRKSDYFRGELPVNNNTGAVWMTLTNVAVLLDGGNPDIVTNTTGNVLLPKTPEAYTYDFDGNLTSDGLWTNVWNGENRRTVIESRSDAPSLSKRKVEWTHLPDGRWIERIVSTNNGTSYYPAFTNRYVWDAQVLLAVLDHTNGLAMSFLRGLDLSGTPQGAGGVGGVLAIRVGPALQCGPLTNTTHFACYDGNGNVSALINAADGSESARYEYGPFAEPLRMTGPMAKVNPLRFSTQYADDVTGDLKYLFRDYDSDEGRWPNRDPIHERGFKLLTERSKKRFHRNEESNLYRFIHNTPIALTDYLGLITAGDVINTPEGDVRVNRQPTPNEREMGNKAICLVSKLIGISQYPPWDVLWIADMEVEGLNYRAGWGSEDRTEYIFINKSMVPARDCDLPPMLSYGIVLAHESDHYHSDSEDPETRHRINDRADTAARKAMNAKINCKNCIYAGFWEIRNQLEKYACECGIDLGKCRDKVSLK